MVVMPVLANGKEDCSGEFYWLLMRLAGQAGASGQY